MGLDLRPVPLGLHALGLLLPAGHPDRLLHVRPQPPGRQAVRGRPRGAGASCRRLVGRASRCGGGVRHRRWRRYLAGAGGAAGIAAAERSARGVTVVHAGYRGAADLDRHLLRQCVVRPGQGHQDPVGHQRAAGGGTAGLHPGGGRHPVHGGRLGQQPRQDGLQLRAHEHVDRPGGGLQLLARLDGVLLGLVDSLRPDDGPVRRPHLAWSHHP